MLEEAIGLHQAGQLAQAETLYRAVLRQDPRQPDALNLLGVIANQANRPELAIGFFRQALAVQPREPDFHRNLAGAYKAVGNIKAALHEYREALRLKPGFLDAHIYLSDALMEAGDLEQSLSHSLEAVRLKPDSALAYCTLGELAAQGHYTFTPDDIARMQKAISGGSQGPHDECLLHFTLAAHLEKQGVYEEAFRHYQRGNELKGEVYRQRNQAFDRGQHRALIDHLIAVFTPDLFERFKPFGSASELPVFVVGMVRSGTSLVEQILASLPGVIGAGELRDIHQITQVLAQRSQVAAPYPGCVTSADPAALGTMANLYVERLTRLSGGPMERVIDKMPHNYLHLGMIALLFKNARIVHCRRDAMDVCASTYLQNFKWLPYAASMEDIGFYFRHYERLMAHWQRVLPTPIHEVSYEEMVADQEAVSRKLVAYCGLPWDDCCLAFHQSRRAVQTASKLQVRQPIFKTSLARWKRFETHLTPLKVALARTDD